ncbi:MAG: peptide-methionine (R)-S-oxide reductase [Candidatus Melainabacteria bacterium HGW-Melainabacteria-1]|nr:MAG: peptide-methionine (R)-S-oxide reductase [Candidatus Melainabacteria bacterium HGW-Melainabacteria-1]
MTDLPLEDLIDAHFRRKPEATLALRSEGPVRNVDLDEDGIYRCRACGNPLFSSETKYHSGSGWPSFWDPITPDAIVEEFDSSHGMARTEIKCGKCGSHLGHVFEDGPRPTGTRYCMNSLSLKFDEGLQEE